MSGRITNSLTHGGVAAASVTFSPAVSGGNISTADDGSYSVQLPIGAYTLTVAKANYTSKTTTVSVVAAASATVDVVLVPTAPVVLNTSMQGQARPGSELTASVTVTPLDGSTVQTIAWSQSNGVAVTLGTPSAATTTVELPGDDTFKDELLRIVGQAQLDRFAVQGLNPFQLDEAGLITLTATVTTTSGTYKQQTQIHTALRWEPNPGLLNVPIGLPVLLNGKNFGTGVLYDWGLAPPAGSIASLADAVSRNPYFTPDIAGVFTVQVTDKAVSPAAPVTLQISAGKWQGAITGQDADGRPVAEGCTLCHKAGGIAPDKFPDWAHSGHAEIFTNNFTTPGHYTTDCLTCHSVGWSLNAANGGFDDALGYPNFLNQFTSNGTDFVSKPGNWTKLLATIPDVAKLANVQCENCHGPNGTTLHFNGQVDAARVNLSADVCAVCHGEPARHARFQQWQDSGHANYSLALDQATVENRGSTAGHCGRCHSAQGFLKWIDQGDLTKVIQGANGNATVAELTALGLTKNTVHPQTCATCHDPHAEGTTSGKPNNTKVRIMDNTSLLPAGFTALGVGRGAICITCHNTRNGAHNDEVGKPTNYTAPHTPAQGDVLMGQNAYFVPIGVRSPHSFIKDTCTTCHMELTPPPAEFSFSGAGTNHTFTPSLTICVQCHGVFDGGTLQESAELEIKALADTMSKYLLAKITAAGTIFIQDYTPHTLNGITYDLKSGKVQVAASTIDSIVEPTEPHGQQGFVVKFKSPVSFTYSPPGQPPHTLSLAQAAVQLGDFTTDGTTKVIPADNVLVRAGWNYFLIHGDNSKGVHNPSFTFGSLSAAKAALEDALEVEVPPI